MPTPPPSIDGAARAGARRSVTRARATTTIATGREHATILPTNQHMSHPTNVMDEENGRVKKNASFLDLLKNDSQGAQTTLQFTDVRFSVKTKAGVKEILHGVSGA